ncbi:MAG: hypothetical protein J4432_01155 [DPANN group archaeon]|nr:hypothetical protein [DPANN group archaeon]
MTNFNLNSTRALAFLLAVTLMVPAALAVDVGYTATAGDSVYSPSISDGKISTYSKIQTKRKQILEIKLDEPRHRVRQLKLRGSGWFVAITRFEDGTTSGETTPVEMRKSGVYVTPKIKDDKKITGFFIKCTSKYFQCKLRELDVIDY